MEKQNMSKQEVVYLLRDDRLWVEGIYKVGRSSNWKQRKQSYGGARILRANEVSNSVVIERRLIDEFRKNFAVAKGTEYFFCAEKRACEIFDEVHAQKFPESIEGENLHAKISETVPRTHKIQNRAEGSEFGLELLEEYKRRKLRTFYLKRKFPEDLKGQCSMFIPKTGTRCRYKGCREVEGKFYCTVHAKRLLQNSAKSNISKGVTKIMESPFIFCACGEKLQENHLEHLYGHIKECKYISPKKGAEFVCSCCRFMTDNAPDIISHTRKKRHNAAWFYKKKLEEYKGVKILALREFEARFDPKVVSKVLDDELTHNLEC
nr:hypothetical protein MarFTME_196 [Marseillevirus futianmevirus]